MSRLGVLEIKNLKTTLHKVFDDYIMLSASGSAEDVERNFLSKALAAFTVMRMTACDGQKASNSLVDGGEDCGIDAVYFDEKSKSLLLIQSKYCEKADSEPSLGDVAKFGNGVDYFLCSSWQNFSGNMCFTQRIEEFKSILGKGDVKVKAILCYSSFNELHQDRKNIFSPLQIKYGEDYLTFKHFNLSSIHEWVIDYNIPHKIEPLNLTIHSPGIIESKYRMIYGLVDLKYVKEIYSKFGDKIVEANIRKYKGSTDVNDAIGSSVTSCPSYFHLFNNGITAYCTSWTVIARDRAKIDKKEIITIDFSVVNGAQTIGVIHNQLKDKEDDSISGQVFLKLISLDSCEDEREFSKLLTNYTNNQNRINPEDFIALDVEQVRLHKTLKLQDIYYVYRPEKKSDLPRNKRFDYKETCRALACKYDDTLQIIRCIHTNPNKVYSVSTGSELFNKERSPLILWRLVQIKRLVEKIMGNNYSTEQGVRKEFFAHSRWLVLHILYKRTNIEKSECMFLSDDEKVLISSLCNGIYEKVWQSLSSKGYLSRNEQGQFVSQRAIKSIFTSVADCEILKRETFRVINATT